MGGSGPTLPACISRAREPKLPRMDFSKNGGTGPENDIRRQDAACQPEKMTFVVRAPDVILNWGFGIFGKLDPAPASSSNPSLPPLLVPGPLISPSRIQSRMPMPRHVAYRPRRTQLHLPPVSHASTPLHPPLPVVSLYCLHVTTRAPLFKGRPLEPVLGGPLFCGCGA